MLNFCLTARRIPPILWTKIRRDLKVRFTHALQYFTSKVAGIAWKKLSKVSEMNIKFRYSEKVTWIWKNLQLCFDVKYYEVILKKNGGFFFKFCGLLTKSELYCWNKQYFIFKSASAFLPLIIFISFKFCSSFRHKMRMILPSKLCLETSDNLKAFQRNIYWAGIHSNLCM